MDLFEILGAASALTTLTAFVCNEYGVLTSESFLYDFLNFLASLGLSIYAAHIEALPFLAINCIWALVSGFDVVKYLWRR